MKFCRFLVKYSTQHMIMGSNIFYTFKVPLIYKYTQLKMQMELAGVKCNHLQSKMLKKFNYGHSPLQSMVSTLLSVTKESDFTASLLCTNFHQTPWTLYVISILNSFNENWWSYIILHMIQFSPYLNKQCMLLH